jgi:hypothetical protein
MLRNIHRRLLGRGRVVALGLALTLAAGLAAAPTAMAAPTVQICNNYATRLCFNVKGGSHRLNTPITAYTKGDGNGTFRSTCRRLFPD